MASVNFARYAINNRALALLVLRSTRLKHRTGLSTQARKYSDQRKYNNICSRDDILNTTVSNSIIDGFKSDEHEFSPNRSRDVVNSAANFASQTPEERLENAESSDQESMAEYGAAPISLSSVMQTNVPEPFRPSGRSPTHLNMPGGSAMRDSKYVSDRQQAAFSGQQPPLPASFGYKNSK